MKMLSFNAILSPSVLTGMAVFSVVTFIASLIIVPIILARLPSDYFLANNKNNELATQTNKPSYFGLYKIIQNIVGALLILAGIAMLVLPGQGVLTILIGLGVTSFPAKARLERKLVSKKSVFKSLNWMRKRAGVEPFLYPEIE